MPVTPSIYQELVTVRDYVRWAVTQFSQAGLYYGHGTDNALDEALQLVLHSLGIPLGAEGPLLEARLCSDEKKPLVLHPVNTSPILAR